jgi:hypothetical protein
MAIFQRKPEIPSIRDGGLRGQFESWNTSDSESRAGA